jgi:hypothetical protein
MKVVDGNFNADRSRPHPKVVLEECASFAEADDDLIVLSVSDVGMTISSNIERLPEVLWTLEMAKMLILEQGVPNE